MVCQPVCYAFVCLCVCVSACVCECVFMHVFVCVCIWGCWGLQIAQSRDSETDCGLPCGFLSASCPPHCSPVPAPARPLPPPLPGCGGVPTCRNAGEDHNNGGGGVSSTPRMSEASLRLLLLLLLLSLLFVRLALLPHTQLLRDKQTKASVTCCPSAELNVLLTKECKKKSEK